MSEDNTVTILDLLNLSLGTPEIGAVNFNLLHRFLLELIKHFSIARKQIDITDDICIQSALEETRMLSGTKSQTHFLAYSSLSDQVDGKRTRLSELKTRDSSTALDSGKRGSEIRSRDSASALEKLDTTASGVRGKDSISEIVRPEEGGSRTGQGRGQVVGSVEIKESLQTKRSPGKSRTGQGIESKGSKENVQTEGSPGGSGKGQGIEASGSKENLQTKHNTGVSLEGQMKEKTESNESLQTKRSTGEMKSVGEAESRKSTREAESGKSTREAESRKSTSSDQKGVKTADGKGIKTADSLSEITHSPQLALYNLAGRSVSSVTKESKRTSPASSKTDIRKRSFIEMVPGLYQLERKISILEAKFESLSAAPTNLEIVQQARDLQSRDSSTTAAGDMWQAMNIVRRIEVAEGAIDGITAMLDDISEQLKKMKENSPDGKLKELSNKIKNMSDTMAEIDGKLKNIVHKTDLKPYITVKKMNEMMEFKLQNYRQLSPTVPKSPKKTISSKLAQSEMIETSSQPAQTSPTISRAQTAKSESSSDEPGQLVATRSQSSEKAQTETTTTTTTTTTTRSGEPAERTSDEQPQTETTSTTVNDEHALIKSATPNSEQAAPETTATTPSSEKAESEQADYYGTAYSEVESIGAASLRAEERGEEGERRGSLNTEAFEELYMTMHDWCDFREEAAQKINNLEECLSNTVDKNSWSNMEQELKNLAEIQQQVKDELNKLAQMQDLPPPKPIASQHDLSQLETSLEGQLQVLSKSLQEMKKNFFQLYEMKETVGGLKESEDHMKSDVENIRKEIMKIMKQLDDEQEVRKAIASAVGRKHSFGAGDSEEFHHIRSSLLEMKNEIDKHNAAMSQLVDDQNKKQLHLEALYGHVDQLENIKADRQQINREIEVKADRKELEKKVSQDKFHNSLSCLDQSVQDLVEKLVGHEATLKQAINHITSDVNSKLDKMDMDTVKDYFEGKLKDLNSKVQRKPNEDKSQAAASRCMLLQPANCISCDRPVHLYREGTKLPSLPLNKPLPPGKSNRPYMSFDLNNVRQKMYDVHNPRGKDQTESLGQAKVQNELLKLGAIKEGDDFPEVANRPCGGNHTLTCPEKRTTIRVNKAYREDLHFIAQLSQKDLSIVDILGYDGHVYKGHVNQLPSIPEIPKNTMARRPTTSSGRPRTSSPI